MNPRDSFLKRKFKNWVLISCRLGPIPSWSTITFQLYAKMAEETDLEKCNFWQFSKLQKPRVFDLDFGSGQGHISIHNTCRTTSIHKRVALSSSNAEIWPFEIHVMSTFREVWTRDSFLRSKLENQALTRCRPGPILSWSTISFDLHAKDSGDRPRKLQFSELQKPHDLDLGSDRGHTGAHLIKVYPHTKLHQNRKKILWMYGHMDGRMDTPSSVSLLGHCPAMT